MATQRTQRVEDDTGMEAAERFYQFLNDFRADDADAAPSTSPDPKYYDNVRHMRDQEENTLFVDFTDVQAYDAELADGIKANYYRLEPYLKRAVLRLVRNVEPSYVDSGKFKEFWISFFNLDTIRKLRDLKTENIGNLVCFSGTVTRTSEVRPELYLGTFRCNQCGTVMGGIEQHFKYTTPLVCKNATCGNRCARAAERAAEDSGRRAPRARPG
jgi:DNA replication licensing factor MCM6